MHIPEKHVEHAFDILKAPDHAVARSAYEFAEKQLKVILAGAEQASDGKTVGERQADALTSDAYERALKDFKLIAENYYKAKDRRDAASAVIEAWRTQQSDLRAMGRVG